MKLLPLIMMAVQPFLCFNMHAAESSEDARAIIDMAIHQFMVNKDVPGVSVAVYEGGKGYVLSYGVSDRASQNPIKPSSIFEIGSITKVFTSTALALQVENGRMSLNDPVTRYLPGLERSRGPISHVTLLQLATHTSSIPRVPPPLKNNRRYSRQSVLDFLKNWRPNVPIGSQFLYSNVGFGLLGYALETVEGRPYASVIDEDICRPLGMTSTMIDVPPFLMPSYTQGYNLAGSPAIKWPRSAWPGGGSLRSTGNDMLKFLLANLRLQGPKRLMQAMQMAQQGYFKVKENFTMGLGWQRFASNQLLLIDKNGGVYGYSSYIGMVPEKKLGIVILANKTKTQVTNVGRKILRQLAAASDG